MKLMCCYKREISVPNRLIDIQKPGVHLTFHLNYGIQDKTRRMA